jgi:hypothetical protein
VKDEEIKIKIDRKQIKIRKAFPPDFDPSTKIGRVKTDYRRSNNKSEIQKALDEMEEDDLDLYE